VPTVLKVKGYRFFFFSLEGNEPAHIHVEKGDGYAKYWLDPIALARSRGFRSRQLREIYGIIEDNRTLFEDKWHEHFSS